MAPCLLHGAYDDPNINPQAGLEWQYLGGGVWSRGAQRARPEKAVP